MKRFALILCILLSLFIVSCAIPENKPMDKPEQTENESVKTDESGTGTMRLLCRPTFRTDIVRWQLQRKVGDEWSEPMSGHWKPAYPDEDNSYELKAGTYRMTGIISDEFADPRLGHGAYDLKPEDIEFTVESGKTVDVNVSFDDGNYSRMPVTFKVKYDGNRNVDHIRITLVSFKNGDKPCKLTSYVRKTNEYKTDSALNEITYVWSGIPLSTEKIRVSVYYTNNTSGSKEFDFNPSLHSEILLDVTR